MRTGRVFAILVALVLASQAQAQDRIRILFVASQHTAPYTEFVEATRHTLGELDPVRVSSDVLFTDELGESGIDASDSHYDLIVAMGTRAAHALEKWQPRLPAVYTLIPELTYGKLRDSGRIPCYENRCTALYIDQPLARQMRIVHAAFGHRRVGVLLGPASRHYHSQLNDAGRRFELPLTTTLIAESDELLPALQSILQDVDVLLALPDPLVYNSRTARNILLTTYRYKVPLVAFSRAYTDAGATLSVYSTPAQMATQTGGIIRGFIESDGSHLPPPEHPQRFHVKINQHVATAIGIDFDQTPEFVSLLKESNNE